MSRTSRRRGHAYECELANRWREQWPGARRGLGQARGGADVPDVEGTPFWVEAKRQKRPNIKAALEQAEANATAKGDARMPIAVCRWDRMSEGEAIVSMRLRDWERLVMGGER